jgi:hypothetical protein
MMSDKPANTTDKKEQPAADNRLAFLQDGVPCKIQIGFIDRVTTIVSKCEGPGCFETINWNDNGHGMSVGKAQWNQKKGEMPQLYERWATKDPKRFNAVFGNYAVRMLDENWLRDTNISKGSDLGDRIAKSLKEPTMQETQTDLLREKAEKAVRLAAEYKHTSELFVAQVADVANQMGWTGCRRALEQAKVADIKDEEQAIKALQHATKKRVNSDTRDAKLITEFSHERSALMGT